MSISARTHRVSRVLSGAVYALALLIVWRVTATRQDDSDADVDEKEDGDDEDTTEAEPPPNSRVCFGRCQKEKTDDATDAKTKAKRKQKNTRQPGMMTRKNAVKSGKAGECFSKQRRILITRCIIFVSYPLQCVHSLTATVSLQRRRRRTARPRRLAPRNRARRRRRVFQTRPCTPR